MVNMTERKPKKKGKLYFTKVHENAIVRYSSTEDREEKARLYVELINPAFNEMVDKIVYTYKFTNLPNVDILKDECKAWLATILDKYDPSKGSKAFSYFSVITKNWFIQKVKKNKKQNQREIELTELPKELELRHISVFNEYDDIREKEEFWGFLWNEIQNWDTEKLKENEKKVLEAIKMLFSQAEDIEIFNKKAIYLYMREITGLNTKQIVNNLNKMRKKYSLFKQKWDEGLM